MSDVKIVVNEVKVVVNRTFSGFLSSLKQEILNGYASCAKSELRNGFFSAQLVKATDSKYVSAVSKMDEAETNAFKIAYFIESISNKQTDVMKSVESGVEVVFLDKEEEGALKALSELVEISQTTGQYEDVLSKSIERNYKDTVMPEDIVIEKKPTQKRQRKGATKVAGDKQQ